MEQGKAPRYERKTAEGRREQIIYAAAECLRTEGRAGLSVRTISARAGVSLGLINYHFHSLEDLTAHAYRHLAGSLLELLKSHAEAAGDTPQARLEGFLQAFFSPGNLDEGLLRAWIVFWAMTYESTEVQTAHDETNQAFQRYLQQLLTDIAAERGKPAINGRLIAIGFSALLDGLWVDWCLNPHSFDPDEGVTICRVWVNSMLGDDRGQAA